MKSRTDALDVTVYGVDVHSGDVRGDSPSYALVRLSGDGVEHDVVSRRKLLRLVADEKPSIVATDNVYEIAEDKDGLVRLLRRLPAETRLVQVTGDEEPEPLSRVASRHDVPYAKKPSKEAEASARLAGMNVGYAVRAFDDKTTVRVSRGRSTGSGGWSEDRYTRKIHGAVRRRAREVEDRLDEEGFEYDKEVTEKYGGLANAEFVVKAPRDVIPFSDERSGDTRIEVDAVRRDGIEFESLAQRRETVVVGVDPGTTTAVAVLDLDGELLNVTSSRSADTAEVIEWIIERGRPVVVAADVRSMPSNVEKIRRSFDASGWTPDDDLAVVDKKRATNEDEYRLENDHERDAAAAATFAYRDHADVFDKVRRKTPRGVDKDDVIARVLVDELPVESAIEAVRDDGDDEGDGGSDDQREPTEEEKQIRRLEKQVGRLKEHVEELEDRVDRKNDEIDELEDELTMARSDKARDVRERREVKRLERKNDELRRKLKKERKARKKTRGKLDRLKKLWRVEHPDFADELGDDYAVVKAVEEFTKTALEDAENSFGLAEGDIVLLEDASGAGRATAERLAGTSPRLVLKNGGMSTEADRVLFDAGVPVAEADGIDMRRIDEFGIMREEDVRDAVERWDERAEERRLRRAEETVDELITEYRVERKRGESG
ncbi:MAG: putative RNase H-like nuclease (RuvC/YqgF family) [Methanobacteriota archaeon]